MVWKNKRDSFFSSDDDDDDDGYVRAEVR